jgi:hypothetical protein
MQRVLQFIKKKKKQDRYVGCSIKDSPQLHACVVDLQASTDTKCVGAFYDQTAKHISQVQL